MKKQNEIKFDNIGKLDYFGAIVAKFPGSVRRRVLAQFKYREMIIFSFYYSCCSLPGDGRVDTDKSGRYDYLPDN